MREVNEVVKEMPAVSGISTWYFVISFINIWNGKEEFKKAEGLVALKKRISIMWTMSPHQKIIVQKECCREESSRVERLQVFAEMEMVLFDS